MFDCKSKTHLLTDEASSRRLEPQVLHSLSFGSLTNTGLTPRTRNLDTIAMIYPWLTVSRNSDTTEDYHAREEGDPLVHDFNHKTRTVTIDKWIQSILHVSLDRISDWSRRLSNEELLRPTTSIMNNLRDYCEANLGTSRYASWATLVNNIISLAPELISNEQVTRSSIIFMQNQLQVEGGEAVHIPDVVVIPTSHFSTPSERTTSQRDILKQTCERLKARYEIGREGLEELSKTFRPDVPSKINTLDEITPEQQSSTCGLKRKTVSSQSSTRKRIKTNISGSTLPTATMCLRDAGCMARYALELLSSTSGTRSHCIHFLIDGPRLMLWYYDAGGIVRSEWMNWICDLPKFAAIVIAFARLDIEQWGIGVPNLKPPRSQDPALPDSLSGYNLMMNHNSFDGVCQPVQVTLQNKIYTEYNLTGRRTTVYDITTELRISEKPCAEDVDATDCPIEDIISPANMHTLFLQLIDCIHELRFKAYILHRDISLGNLMYEQLVDGTIKIILNDFDYAAMVDDHGCPTTPNSSKHPAGTLPFMAHELLNPYTDTSVTHYVRHDLESVFLVALWLIIKSSLRTKATTQDAVRLKKERRHILQGWECGSVEDVYLQKLPIFTNPGRIIEIAQKVDMGAYEDWVTLFCEVFLDAYRALNASILKAKHAQYAPDPDVAPRGMTNLETLDGLTSRDHIQKVLRRWEKRQVKEIERFVLLAHTVRPQPDSEAAIVLLVSTYFNDIITKSPLIKYKIELERLGFEDGPRSELEIAERLQSLVSTEMAWSNPLPRVTATYYIPILVKDKYHNVTTRYVHYDGGIVKQTVIDPTTSQLEIIDLSQIPDEGPVSVRRMSLLLQGNVISVDPKQELFIVEDRGVGDTVQS
ncbi:hypothetical protein NLI96_g2159 [Meripilus lineatus]|uniref:Fungal-type protein kinase domain-containing protein n=1 Tax=Meripilus lineatus TaxID=2056292 RepID=A0AAD5VEM0_9APHY|nr:hypothetical protein NLI96_g2159 [Physisporinus lineatus]